MQGNLTFSTKAKKQMYDEVCKRTIVPCKYVDVATMEEFGIKHAFDDMVDRIGWKAYFEIHCPALIELIRDLYTTFLFTTPDGFTLDSPGLV